MKRKNILQNTWVVAALALVCCALWGSAFPCIKIGYEMFSIGSDAAGSQILFAGYRFALAGVLTILFGSLLQRKVLLPNRNSMGKVLKLSLTQTVFQYLFFYIGLAHTSGVKGAIIVGTNSLAAILIASLIFHQEKLTVPKTAGCLVGLAGVVAANLSGSGMDFDLHWNGEGFVLLSVISYACSSAMMKAYAQDEDPVMLSGYQFLTGGVVMIAAGFFMGGKVVGFTAASTGMLLYLAFLSAVAYTLWGILLKYNPVSKVAIYGFMNPVIGVLLSAVLLGEGEQAFHIKNILALILVSAGIVIVNVFPLRRDRKKVRTETTDTER